MSSRDNLPDLTPQELSGMWVREGITESAADNGLDSYEAFLGFDRNDLSGKSILEVGIGNTARLQHDMKAAGIDATVVGISPDLSDSYNRHLVGQYAEPGDKNVAAVAEVLPFADESFDEAWALYSLTYYTYDPGQTKAWVSEIGRVLRPNGNFRLGPDYGSMHAFGKNYELLREYAHESGMTLTFESRTSGGEYILLHKGPQAQA